VIQTRGIIGLKANKKYSDEICDFVNQKCLQVDPVVRASAAELLEHSFIKTRMKKAEFAKTLQGLNIDHLQPVDQMDDVPDYSGCNIL